MGWRAPDSERASRPAGVTTTRADTASAAKDVQSRAARSSGVDPVSGNDPSGTGTSGAGTSGTTGKDS